MQLLSRLLPLALISACAGRSSTTPTLPPSPPAAAPAPAPTSADTAPAPTVSPAPAVSTTPPASATAAAAASSPAASAVPARLAYLRVHMDHAPVARVPAAEAARRQQLTWIRDHGAAVGGLPTYWIRVGKDRMWAARPATSWEDLKAQGPRLGALDDALRAAVGPAFDANEARVHQAIDEHHNELLRPVPDLTLAPADRALAVTELASLPSLRVVAIDKPLPARQAAYLAAVTKINAALAAAEPGVWRAVYHSSLGSGAYVHFLGADRPLTLAQLSTLVIRALERSLGRAEAARVLRNLSSSLHQHEILPASLALELSTLPPAAAAAGPITDR